MKESRFNDGLEKYRLKDGYHSYGKELPQDLIYVSDVRKRVPISYDIADGLKQIQDILKEHEDKGYEHYYYHIDCEHDTSGNCGMPHYYIKIDFYKLETKEERQARFDNANSEINRRLSSLRQQAVDAQTQLEALRNKLK